MCVWQSRSKGSPGPVVRGTNCDVSIDFYKVLASLSRSGVGLAGPALAPLAAGGDKKFKTEPLAPLAGARFPMARPAYLGMGAIDAWQDHVNTTALLSSKSLATATAASGSRIRLDTF